MRIGLITTLNTNIGDDFIREGICLVLRKLFEKRKIDFVAVNKHKPLSVFPKWHIARLAEIVKYLPRGKYRIGRPLEEFASKLCKSMFHKCDMLVQCGAPVLWPGCHRAEWSKPLWHNIIGPLSKTKLILNIAAGSCYPWENQPKQIADPNDAQFLRSILSYCHLTTARDSLAQELCGSLGTPVPLIPCSAFLAAGDKIGKLNNSAVILINYMEGGGHYEWDQAINSSAWRETTSVLIKNLGTRHKLAFLCHNEVEYKLAQHLDPTIPRLWPKTPLEYFSVISDAKVALCNRMHASVGLAGLGIPSVAVGTDTRLLMVRAINLPCFYIKEASAKILEEKLEDLLMHRFRERESLLSLKSETWQRYIDSLGDII
ncbi:polysaccharide pyruvyl transferase family protein [Thermodesulfobacteriota bacterium]